MYIQIGDAFNAILTHFNALNALGAFIQCKKRGVLMIEYILMLESEDSEKGTYKTKVVEAKDRNQAVALGRSYAADYKMRLHEIWELVYRVG